jgi:hypothetical protein
VERCHRTLNDYCLAGNEARSLDQLQAHLDEAVQLLAHELPSEGHGCHGLPPVQAHPQLLARPRPFRLQEELARFDLDKVHRYLAGFTWRRKVGKTGQICIGGHHHYYSVGRAFAGQEILARFDPADGHLVFSSVTDPPQEIVRRRPRALSISDLTGLPDPSALFGQQLPLQLAFQ